MRLIWSERALTNLGDVHARAPVQARRLQLVVESLREAPFPGMHRRLPDRLEEHVLTSPPYAVFYVLSGDTLTILRIEDARRRITPW